MESEEVKSIVNWMTDGFVKTKTWNQTTRCSGKFIYRQWLGYLWQSSWIQRFNDYCAVKDPAADNSIPKG